MIKKINNSSIKLVIIEILFFGLLTACYLTTIIPYWGYMGFEGHFSFELFVLGILIIIVFSFLGALIENGFLKTVWHIILMLCLFPQVVYFFSSSGNFKPVLGCLIFLSILYIFNFIRLRRLKGPVVNIESSKGNYTAILIFAIILMLPLLYYLPYINVSNIFLKDVYETRAKFRDINHLSVIGYIAPAAARIVFPALLIIAFERKKWILVLVNICIILYIYMAYGALKSIFFGILATLIFYWGKTFSFKIKIFIFIFSLLLLFSIIEPIIFNSVNLSNLGIRRLFFIPPYLETFYYDYFTNNKLFYSHSFLSGIIEYEYPTGIARFIGDYVVGREGTNANVGVIPDGYISIGWIGVVIHSIFLAVSIKFIEELKIDSKFFGIFFVYIYYLNTAFIGTYVLTHGFLFLLIFSFFCLRNYD